MKETFEDNMREGNNICQFREREFLNEEEEGFTQGKSLRRTKTLNNLQLGAVKDVNLFVDNQRDFLANLNEKAINLVTIEEVDEGQNKIDDKVE